ncbi:zinc finger, CCHC-type containing protein [Tanacetum coccineum]
MDSSTQMAFGGSTRNLGSFGEETNEITDLHQILEEVLLTKRGDGVASIKRRRRDLFSDGVWKLGTTLGYKWIFKRKMKVDGTIDKFKTRLIVVSFSSYSQSSDPSNGCQNIILNGDLEEEVYMKQPKGFVMLGNEHKVCKLAKSLYGLKQAPKQWHQEFDEVVLSSGFLLNQSDKCVYSKFDGSDCSPVSTPMDPVEKLKPNTGKPVNQLKYSRAIGCLMYAMTSTKPDIAYAVGTMNYGLSYVGYPSVLEAYSDASWINHVKDSSSTSGWVFLLTGGAISWASKKQTCITGSTMEFEYVALAAAGKEVEWLRNLIHKIPIWPKPIAWISIHCDSAATLAKAYSQIYNGKSRHLGVRHSMIRESIMNGVISIEFVRSQHNLADHLTKGLARDLVINSLLEMGTRVFIFPRCKTKRTTYVNTKFCRFKKLGLGFLYVH